jgi:hypothetical protein
MEKYKKYKEAFPNKTDAQCIESLCWEVSDKVETIHKLLEDMADNMVKLANYLRNNYQPLAPNQAEWQRIKDKKVLRIEDIINSLNKHD